MRETSTLLSYVNCDDVIQMKEVVGGKAPTIL